MWSKIAQDNSVEKDEVIALEEEIEVIDVPRAHEIKFRRRINKFIDSNYELLEEIYNKCFKEYRHISKEDFYIFAYNQSVK